jgi:hypothetical protein
MKNLSQIRYLAAVRHHQKLTSMKKLLLLSILCLCLSGLHAQNTCMPDTSMLDSIEFIFPLPFSEAIPDGGIFDTACVDRPFEFTFTLLIPDTIVLNNLEIRVLGMSMATSGAIRYDPPLSNFSYVCDPPNCSFPANEVGCVKIFGTPTAQEIGAHELKISAIVNVGIPLTIEFPDPTLFPGTYLLHVQQANSAYCLAASTKDLSSEVRLLISPNPMSGRAQFLFDAERAGRYEFRVHDLLGKVVHRERLDLQPGQNAVEFDAGALANGMYLFSLSDGRGVLTRKIVVNR